MKTWFQRKIYLPFIAKPVVVFESVQKKSRAFGLPQQSVKAVVNISASPLTRFEIMPKQDLLLIYDIIIPNKITSVLEFSNRAM